MDQTAWPAKPIPKAVKSLVTTVFSVLDSEGQQCSQRLASDFFTADGELIINKRSWQGSESMFSPRPLGRDTG